MLTHVRLNVPAPLVDQVRSALLDNAAVTNVTHHAGASLRPRGDVLEADVAREAAGPLIDALTHMGLARDGGIVIEQPDGAPFDAATQVDRAAAGDPNDAVIWRLVRASAAESVHVSFNYMMFLIIATALAAIAVLTDSSVLVVGAMVVGPEFALVSAICVGLAFLDWKLTGRAAWTLLWTFLVAIASMTAISYAGYRLGFFDAEAVTRPRPQTGFIWRPDKWSFIVACWAGAAGVLAVATEKTNAMVGVFISVTTVPAAGNMALGLAIGNWAEVNGSAQQLGLNIAGMILAGVIMLVVERVLWRRISSERRRRISHRVARHAR